MIRVLILGGTRDARRLADHLCPMPGVEIISSLAGRTRTPLRPPGEVRSGGFGGVDGLARFLSDHAIALVVDATHPFAAAISQNAARACARTEIERLMLVRPPWRPQADDAWTEADDHADAARLLDRFPGTVFLAVGRQGLAAYAHLTHRRFVIRLVDPPPTPLPFRESEIVVGRGPFALAKETALLGRHRIAVMVSKNAGGDAGYAKIEAARALRIPVIMIRRPPSPVGPSVATVEQAVSRISALAEPG